MGTQKNCLTKTVLLSIQTYVKTSYFPNSLKSEPGACSVWEKLDQTKIGKTGFSKKGTESLFKIDFRPSLNKCWFGVLLPTHLKQALPQKIYCLSENLFLAHLSRRLMGELIVYQSLRRPSVRRPSVRQHFQTSSPLKPLGQLNSNFIWKLLRMRERKFVQMVLVT